MILCIREDEEGMWPNAKVTFMVLEHVFTLIFLMEFLYKVYPLRLKVFKDAFNVFDALLVWSSVAELYALQPLGGKSMGNLTILRFSRFGRLIRSLRAIRTMPMFKGLLASSVCQILLLLPHLALLVLRNSFWLHDNGWTIDGTNGRKPHRRSFADT